MSEVQIRPYEIGDEAGIVELLNKTFTKWPKQSVCNPIDYWRWKYLKNPYQDKFIVLALDGEKVVGCFHTMLQMIKIGDNVYSSSTGTDLAVDQSYRNQGLYKKMREVQRNLEKDKIAFHYGVSNNPILIATNLKEKHGALPHIPYVYVKIDDIDMHMKNTGKIPIHKKYGFKVLKLLNKLRITNKISEFRRIKINHITKFGDAIEEFWRKISGHHNFIVERRSKYLNWRYCDSQCNDYTVMEAVENNEILGYMVLKINNTENNYQFGFIVDLLALRNREDAAEALLSTAIDFFKAENVNIVRWQITNHHPYTSIASRHGFLNSRQINPLDYPRETARIRIDEAKLKDSPPNMIHFAFGDFDWF